MHFEWIFFFNDGLDLSNVFVPYYNYLLVALSILIGIFSSFSALQISGWIRLETNPRSRFLWSLAGIIVMACGTFTMHFVGMLAYNLPLPVTYDLNLTLLSFLPVVLGASIVIYIIKKGEIGPLKILVAGFFMTLGVASTHYLGVRSMQMNAYVNYDITFIGFSILTGYLLAIFSLYVKFLSGELLRLDRFWTDFISASLMGLAISSLHYIGMGAAAYFPTLKGHIHIEGINTNLVVLILTSINIIMFASSIIANIARGHVYKIAAINKELVDQKLALDSSALVSETDLSGNIIYANEKFCHIAGHSQEELLGRNHRMIKSSTHPQEFWEDMWVTIRSGGIWKGEVCNKAKDGSIYWVDSTIIPIRGISGKIVKYTSVRIDITEKKKSESMLIHSSKMASMGELAAGVGHEINNPLAIVAGNLNIVTKAFLKAEVKDEGIQEALLRQREGLLRIEKIVESLATYSRGDDGAVQLLDAHHLIGRTFFLVAEVFKNDGVILNKKLDAKNHLLGGNTGKFQQALMILLSNAKDATLKEKIPIIKILTSNEKSLLKISVSDNGSGIPEEIREKIFDSFFTTKEIGKGTGIGLGVLHKILKDMNAKISLDSEIDVGTTFTLSFPLLTDSEVKALTPEKTLAPEEMKLHGRALIVDDESRIRDLLYDLLEDLGLDVDQAESGKDALELISKNRYDFICTDMKMPGMDGDVLIQEAKKLPNGNTHYFIISGGSTKINPINKGESIEDGFIKKPFTEESVYRVLSEFNKGEKQHG